MRSIIVTPDGEVTAAVLHGAKDIDKAIGSEIFDGRRVCRIPDGFLYMYFDDNFIAKCLPVNRHVCGLYARDIRGTVVLQACNEMGNTIDMPSSITTTNWRSEIDTLRALLPDVQQDWRSLQTLFTAMSADRSHGRGETGQISGHSIADLEATLIAQEGKPHNESGLRMDRVSVLTIGGWCLIRNATRRLASSYMVTRYPAKEGSMEWPSLQLAWRYRNTAPDDDPVVHEQVWQAWLAEHGTRRG